MKRTQLGIYATCPIAYAAAVGANVCSHSGFSVMGMRRRATDRVQGASIASGFGRMGTVTLQGKQKRDQRNVSLHDSPAPTGAGVDGMPSMAMMIPPRANTTPEASIAGINPIIRSGT